MTTGKMIALTIWTFLAHSSPEACSLISFSLFTNEETEALRRRDLPKVTQLGDARAQT